jgi:hypothetical protein
MRPASGLDGHLARDLTQPLRAMSSRRVGADQRAEASPRCTASRSALGRSAGPICPKSLDDQLWVIAAHWRQDRLMGPERHESARQEMRRRELQERPGHFYAETLSRLSRNKTETRRGVSRQVAPLLARPRCTANCARQGDTQAAPALRTGTKTKEWQANGRDGCRGQRCHQVRFGLGETGRRLGLAARVAGYVAALAYQACRSPRGRG